MSKQTSITSVSSLVAQMESLDRAAVSTNGSAKGFRGNEQVQEV